MSKIDTTPFKYDCTGDACAGDIVLFTESVFGGSYRSPHYRGDRRIVARIIRESYGQAKQQHTFSLEVLASDGLDAIDAGKKIRRKGRNVYRNGTKRLPWDNEEDRSWVLDEKHKRGDRARDARDSRKAAQYWGHSSYNQTLGW